MRQRQAFTLVELLVVLGVLGTLMGLLLPAVQAARAAARASQCKSNLHDIGIYITNRETAGGLIKGWYENEIKHRCPEFVGQYGVNEDSYHQIYCHDKRVQLLGHYDCGSGQLAIVWDFKAVHYEGVKYVLYLDGHVGGIGSDTKGIEEDF